ncbi:MAG: hypothetical protein K0R50_2593 [Eubacterium sp.]|nr:hypothetical protein [Eubacterium sp.]
MCCACVETDRVRATLVNMYFTCVALFKFFFKDREDVILRDSYLFPRCSNSEDEFSNEHLA